MSGPAEVDLGLLSQDLGTCHGESQSQWLRWASSAPVGSTRLKGTWQAWKHRCLLRLIEDGMNGHNEGRAIRRMCFLRGKKKKEEKRKQLSHFLHMFSSLIQLNSVYWIPGSDYKCHPSLKWICTETMINTHEKWLPPGWEWGKAENPPAFSLFDAVTSSSREALTLGARWWP